MDSLGGKIATYEWVDYAGESGTDECWADTETYDWPETPVFFVPGQGLWIEAKSNEQSVVGSGEVSKKDVKVQLQNNATLSGNPFPASLALQDILPIGPNIVGNLRICLLDDLGGKIATYEWVDYAGESGTDECWADTETYDWPEEEVFFDPGQGLWVEAKSTDQYIQIPSPISDAE